LRWQRGILLVPLWLCCCAAWRLTSRYSRTHVLLCWSHAVERQL